MGSNSWSLENKNMQNLCQFTMFYTPQNTLRTIQNPFAAQQLLLGKQAEAFLLLCPTILTQIGSVIGRKILWQRQAVQVNGKGRKIIKLNPMCELHHLFGCSGLSSSILLITDSEMTGMLEPDIFSLNLSGLKQLPARGILCLHRW